MFMIDTGVRTLDSLFGDICVLVTAAFALTLVPGLRQPERLFCRGGIKEPLCWCFWFSGWSKRQAFRVAGWLNERIVAVCAAGLVAGPWVGLAVSVFVTWLAVAHDGLPLGSIAISMLCGGLAGGWLYRWRPKLAQYPLTGFCLTLGVSLLAKWPDLLLRSQLAPALHRLEDIGMAPVLQGLGTALILAIVAQVRDRDEQTRAAASAEARALQARMNPHFLFNALNALAALSNDRATRSAARGGAVAPFSASQFRSTGASCWFRWRKSWR